MSMTEIAILVLILIAAAVLGPKLWRFVDAAVGADARRDHQTRATELRTAITTLERYPKAAWDRTAKWIVPLVDRPAVVLGRTIKRLGHAITGAGSWNVDAIASLLPGILDPVILAAVPHLAALEARIRAAIASVSATLRGSCHHGVISHVAGHLVYATGLGAFAVAEITLSAALFEILLHAPPLLPLPPVLRDITLAHVVATYGTVFISAIVISDLTHRTRFAEEFETVAGFQRRALLGTALTLLLTALLAGLVASLARADLITRLLSPEAAAQLVFLATALPIPILLGVVALIAGPALGVLWLLVLIGLGAALFIVNLLNVVVDALHGLLKWVARVVDAVIRVIGVVALAFAVAALAAALVTYFAFFAAPTGALVVVALITLLAPWLVAWAAARAAWLSLRGLGGSAGLERLLKAMVELAAQPLRPAWDALARSAIGRRVGLRPIRFPDEKSETADVTPNGLARRTVSGPVKRNGPVDRARAGSGARGARDNGAGREEDLEHAR